MRISGDGYTRRTVVPVCAVLLHLMSTACRAEVTPQARRELATAYELSARDRAHSLEVATELAKRYPRWAAPRSLAGRLHAIDGSLDLARASLHAALELDSADREALLWYARVAVASADEEIVDDAASRVEQVLARDAGDLRLHHSLGLLFEEQGDVTAALAAYRRGLERLDHAARLHLDAGRAYYRLGLTDRAYAAVEVAAAVAGDGPVGVAAERLLARLRRGRSGAETGGDDAWE